MLEPEFNIKTRDNYEPLISLEEFLSNRNIENTNIKDKLKESNKETEFAAFLHADLKENLYLKIKKQLG